MGHSGQQHTTQGYTDTTRHRQEQPAHRAGDTTPAIQHQRKQTADGTQRGQSTLRNNRNRGSRQQTARARCRAHAKAKTAHETRCHRDAASAPRPTHHPAHATHGHAHARTQPCSGHGCEIAWIKGSVDAAEAGQSSGRKGGVLPCPGLPPLAGREGAWRGVFADQEGTHNSVNCSSINLVPPLVYR